MSDPVAPLMVTPRNVEHVLGVRWRWVCELAERHGIAVWVIRGKRLLPAGPIVEAMRREAAAAPEPVELSEDALAERMRERLGLERVG